MASLPRYRSTGIPRALAPALIAVALGVLIGFPHSTMGWRKVSILGLFADEK
jgi:hypothetical protein